MDLLALISHFKKFWFVTLVATILLPTSVLLIPQYLMFREMGMLDSYLPLYLPMAFATQGFFVFMLIQFLRGLPTDMEEAAQIDGCKLLSAALVHRSAYVEACDYLCRAVPVYVVSKRFLGAAYLYFQRRKIPNRIGS